MIVYLNGEFLDVSQARIGLFDRGLWFGDGLYEAVRYFNGHGAFLQPHIDRMNRGLHAIRIEGVDVADFRRIGAELLQRNGWTDAAVYWLVTRGEMKGRSHLPDRHMNATVAAFASPLPGLDAINSEPPSAEAVLVPDERWGRCDIKSLNLLANVMAVMEADRQGASEAILHRGQIITESASANVIVVRNGRAATPPIDDADAETGYILHGVTRRIVMEVTEDLTATPSSLWPIEVRPIRRDELHEAEEIVIVSTVRLVKSITKVNNTPVGSGTPGPIARELLHCLVNRIRKECAD